TVVHSGEQILAREDGDVVGELQKALEGEGVEFRLNARTTAVERREQGVLLRLAAPAKADSVSRTHLLLATGRLPNTDALALAVAGVETDPRGYVKVNARLETTAPGVWALGDVKGGPAFTHLSYNDYQIVYGNLIEGKDLTIEGRIVPYAVFTDPQLGGVG